MDLNSAFTEHAHGRLEHRLQGVHRGRAHIALLEKFTSKDFEGVAVIARQDPSLLIEPIPSRHPIVPEWHEETWSAQAKKHKRWLSRAAGWDSVPFVNAVQAVLEAGVHPNDRDMFVNDSLLGFQAWRSNPRLLRIALHHGATPTLPPERPGGPARSAVCPVLQELCVHLSRAGLNACREEVETLIESLNLLLDAEANAIDNSSACDKASSHSSYGGGSLLADSWYETRSPWVVAPLKNIVRRLKEAGEGLHHLTSSYGHVPLSVFALRNRNLPFALTLIELGDKVEDEFICRGATRDAGPVFSLLEEARKAMGHKAAAVIVEALMRRQYVSAQSAVALNDGSRGSIKRRRARAV